MTGIKMVAEVDPLDPKKKIYGVLRMLEVGIGLRFQ